LTVAGPFRSTSINGHRQTAPARRVGAKKRHFKTQNNIEPFRRRTKVIPG
jgi:hypothetical protein